LSGSSCGKEISYTIPGIVKLWDSPQLGWGLSDGVNFFGDTTKISILRI